MMTAGDPYRVPEIPPESDAVAGQPIQHRWLVILSCWLAILLELLPVEADVLYDLSQRPPGVAALVAVKLMFMTVILSPLAAFVKINGWDAVHQMQGRIITIGVVMGLSLLLFASMLLPLLS